MPNLPQLLCSGEAGAPSNRGQLPGWKRKSSNHFPNHPNSSWNKAGLHPGKKIGGKAKGDWQLLLFRDCLSFQHLLPHLGPDWTRAALKGTRFCCSLLGAGAAPKGCSGTRQGAGGLLHSVPAHTQDLQATQKGFIHHSNRNLSVTA